MVIDAMVRIYVNLVQNGRRTIASIPTDYQAPVQAIVNPTAATPTSSTTAATAK